VKCLKSRGSVASFCILGGPRLIFFGVQRDERRAKQNRQKELFEKTVGAAGLGSVFASAQAAGSANKPNIVGPNVLPKEQRPGYPLVSTRQAGIASKASNTETIADVEHRLQTSLKRMNTNYIDLYYLHEIEETDRLNKASSSKCACGCAYAGHS